jgi:hypothetical protein
MAPLCLEGSGRKLLLRKSRPGYSRRDEVLLPPLWSCEYPGAIDIYDSGIVSLHELDVTEIWEADQPAEAIMETFDYEFQNI